MKLFRTTARSKYNAARLIRYKKPDICFLARWKEAVRSKRWVQVLADGSLVANLAERCLG
jgi:hypothetical protein